MLASVPFGKASGAKHQQSSAIVHHINGRVKRLPTAVVTATDPMVFLDPNNRYELSHLRTAVELPLRGIRMLPVSVEHLLHFQHGYGVLLQQSSQLNLVQ